MGEFFEGKRGRFSELCEGKRGRVVSFFFEGQSGPW
jgi:hypothetical protein